MEGIIMSLDNLKNENISNFQDKGKVQKKT